MEYEIALSTDGAYVILTIKGTITTAAMITAITEAYAFGKEAGVNCYLTDLRQARNKESVLNNYAFAYDRLPKTPGLDHSSRVVMLVDPDDHSHDFVEMVTKNAGSNVTLFRDPALAEAFLRR